MCVQELGRKQTFVVTSLLPNSGWKERKKERSWLSRQSCYCRQGERNKKTRRPLLHLAPPPILLHLLHGLVVLGISPDCFDFLLGPLFLPSLPPFLFFFFSFSCFSRVCFLPLFCFRVRILFFLLLPLTFDRLEGGECLDRKVKQYIIPEEEE